SDDTPRIVESVIGAIDDAVPVTACGGIAAPRDAFACLDAGAATLQLYTGLIYRGPAIVGDLTSALASARGAEAEPGAAPHGPRDVALPAP
ncbi:MAG TPA: hypothetical protein VEC15_04135, partial [Actinomycetota bacterium]|nr:hypothetical protein [Actinomycetota bacterium]